MAFELQITAPTGLTLYAQLYNRNGQIWNTNSNAFEMYNAANWLLYVINFTEAVPNTGVYFGSMPSGFVSATPAAGEYLISVWQQQPSNSTPTITDNQQGITLDVSWNGSAVTTTALLQTNNGQSNQSSIPATQNSLQTLQGIINTLYVSLALMAGGASVQSVEIDGQRAEYRNPITLWRVIQMLEKRVGRLNGSAPSVMTAKFPAGVGEGGGWPWGAY